MTGMFKLKGSIRKFAAYGLTLALILGIGFTNVTAYADNAAEDQDMVFSDVGGHWAKDQILDWSKKGLVAGYEDGTFGPERGVTRAEFITFVNRAYGLKEKAPIAFVDVSSEDWFVDEVAKAVAAEYISGYDDGTMRPNAKISRLEAAVILYRLLRLDSYKDESWIDGFNDSAAIADWGRVYVNSAVAEGYFSGYPDGTFKPGQVITRAETVSLLSKAVGTLYNVPGVYGPEDYNGGIKGNVTVNVSGVTLKDLTIEGDLFLTAGIGDGDFEADGVVVKGRTIVSGGGYESIVFNNSTLGDVIVYVVDGKVRVVAMGDTSINDVILESGGFLQEENLTGEGFGNVQILVLKPGQEVELDGDFDSVDIEASVGMSVTGNTRIKELNVSEGADGTEINLGKDAVIDTLTLDGGTDVTGKGQVKSANVNTDDYSFETEPGEKIVKGEGTKKGEEEEEKEEKDRRREPSKKSVTDIEVEGDAIAGSILMAETTPAGATVHYQWQKANVADGDFADIEEATNKTYRLENTDVGSYIRVVVEGYGSYRGEKTSAATEEVVEPAKSTYKFTYVIPDDPVGANVPVEIPVTTEYDILGEEGYDFVLIKFEGESTEGDNKVTFKITEHNSGIEYTFEEGFGSWGPPEGWPLPVNFSSENTWTLIFPEAGNYTIKFWLEDLDGNAIIVEAEEEVEVKDVFTVTFDVDGIAPQSVVSGQKAVKPEEPTEDGYYFEYWFIGDGSGEEEYDFDTPVTESIHLHAKFIQNKDVFFVIFDVSPDGIEILLMEFIGEHQHTPIDDVSIEDFTLIKKVEGGNSDLAIKNIKLEEKENSNYTISLQNNDKFEDGFYQLIFEKERYKTQRPLGYDEDKYFEISEEKSTIREAIKPEWKVKGVEIAGTALPEGVSDVDYKLTIGTEYKNKDNWDDAIKARTVTTYFMIPDDLDVTVYYPVWEDGALIYKSATEGKEAFGMKGHSLSADNIEADGIVYVALGEGVTDTEFAFHIGLKDAAPEWEDVVYGEDRLEVDISNL